MHSLVAITKTCILKNEPEWQLNWTHKNGEGGKFMLGIFYHNF